jgi:GH25 family lysozyme M1 (1,4-beta-N-acetylmuramidase)
MLNPVVADCAHFNPIDWDALATGPIRGIIHKAFQFVQDEKYAPRRAEAEKRGLGWGAYCFSTDHSPAETAAGFLKAANPGATTLCALDYERNIVGGAQHNMSAEQADEWCDRVEQVIGRTVWIYGGDLVRERISAACLRSSTLADKFSRRPLWHCRYAMGGADVTLEQLSDRIRSGVPAPWSDWTLLQYAADGNGPLPHKVPGLEDKADLSVCRDEDKLADLWPGTPLR